jgi:hypothetical protein
VPRACMTELYEYELSLDLPSKLEREFVRERMCILRGIDPCPTLDVGIGKVVPLRGDMPPVCAPSSRSQSLC